MATNSKRRIAKEIADISKDTVSGISCEPINESDLSNLRASFVGPPDTPYEGGTYIIVVTIPTEYPFKAPRMVFATKIWHPNVSSVTGAICLDTLSTGWSPVLNLRSAVLSIQSLLTSPEPKDPQDAEVAKMMLNHPKQFEARAREWAIHYAGAPKITNWSKSNARDASEPPKPVPHLSKEEEARQQILKYQGYNKDMVDRFVSMGFEVEQVVEAFNYVHLDRNNGQEYELEEEYMGDVTARLLGEP